MLDLFIRKNDISDFTDSLMAAQAFVFFVAGFETSSTTISNALYELALNEKIQHSLRKEINEVYAKYGEDLTYDNVKKMDYLDKVFKGTLFEEKILNKKVICFCLFHSLFFFFDDVAI